MILSEIAEESKKLRLIKGMAKAVGRRASVPKDLVDQVDRLIDLAIKRANADGDRGSLGYDLDIMPFPGRNNSRSAIFVNYIYLLIKNTMRATRQPETDASTNARFIVDLAFKGLGIKRPE